MGGGVQDYQFFPRRSPLLELLKFIQAREEVVREHLTAGLLELHGLTFWVSEEFTYTHPAKEIVEMKPQDLHSGKVFLAPMTNLEDQIDRMTEVLEDNANLTRESSGLRVEIPVFRFKIAHYSPIAGRKQRELVSFC